MFRAQQHLAAVRQQRHAHLDRQLAPAAIDEPPVVPNHHRMVCCDRKFASKRGPDGDEGLGLTLE